MVNFLIQTKLIKLKSKYYVFSKIYKNVKNDYILEEKQYFFI